MNIFEGSRRIAKVVALLATVLAAVLMITTDPYIEIHYGLKQGNLQLVDACVAGKSTYTRVTAANLDVYAVLCGIENGPSEIGLPEEDAEKVRAIVSDRKMEYYAKAVGITIVSLGVYWLAILAIGWIVRGFLGIPRGQDCRTVTIQAK